MATVLLAVSVALLYDVAAVRAGQPAQEWRRRVADELAGRPLDSPWVLGGAAFAVVLGLLLLWLACAPGLRAVLPMRPCRSGELRGGLDRKAAAVALRDAAIQVPGVSAAGAKVSRRRAKVWAKVRYRDMDTVRAELDGALTEGMESLGLARSLPVTLSARWNHGR